MKSKTEGADQKQPTQSVSPNIYSEKQYKPASIQPRPQIPGRDEHVTKRLDQQTHLPTRPGIREQSEQVRGQPHQHAQMTPIPETEDIKIEVKWPKRQKPSTKKPKKPAGHRRLTTYYQWPNCTAKDQMNRLKIANPSGLLPLLSPVRGRFDQTVFIHALTSQREK